VSGDISILGQLASLMVEFDPLFPIMPGTQRRAAAPEMEDGEEFKAEIGAIAAE
jgi:hypothetical protein